MYTHVVYAIKACTLADVSDVNSISTSTCNKFCS